MTEAGQRPQALVARPRLRVGRLADLGGLVDALMASCIGDPPCCKEADDVERTTPSARSIRRNTTGGEAPARSTEQAGAAADSPSRGGGRAAAPDRIGGSRWRGGPR